MAGELDFRGDGGGAADGIGGDGGFESGEALRGVVEVRDGLVEARAAEGGGEVLERTEGACGLVGLGVGLDFVVAAGALDEGVGAPDVAVGINGVGFAVSSGDAGEGAAAGFGAGADLLTSLTSALGAGSLSVSSRSSTRKRTSR